MKNNLIKQIVLFCSFCYGLNAEIITPNKAYEMATNTSHKLKSNHYNMLSKKEAINQYYARLYPKIGASINYNEVNYEVNELQLRNEYDIDETSTDYSVYWQQVLYDKEILTKIDVEKKRSEVYAKDYDVKKQKLAEDVLTAYLNVFKVQNSIRYLDSMQQYNQQNLKLLQRKHAMNLSSKVDYLEAQVEFNKSNLALNKEKQNYKVELFKLKQLIQADNIEIPLLNVENFSNNIKQFFEEIEYDPAVLKQNLEIKQAQLGVELATLEVDNAFSAHYPKLTFDARYTQYVSDDTTTDYENYSKIGVNLEIPLYQGGAVSSRVEEMKLKRLSANEQLYDALNELEVEFDELKLQINNSLISMKVYDEALISAKTYEDSVKVELEKGLKSIVDFYKAKNEVLKIELDFVDNIQLFIESYVKFLIVTNQLDKLSIIDKLLTQ